MIESVACWQVEDMLKCTTTIMTSRHNFPLSNIGITESTACPQVEDMLKRSFAEFHAQQSHPEALQKLAEGKARLDAFRVKPWPHSPHATTQQDVLEYYQISERIQALTSHIQV